MPKTTVKTTKPDLVDLEYETFGSPENPALLLIMGFAVQMIHWDTDFCEQLAAAGRYVIRFDNRDVGLSTKLDGVTVSPMDVMSAQLSGSALPDVPYTLSDMANDCVGLLDALDIDKAHVMGASMGGMIAQTVAIDHPDRVLSLISIMSSTGDPRVGKPAPEALAVLLTPPPVEREAFIDATAKTVVWSSKRYQDVELLRRRAAAAFDRSFYPDGLPRQLAAIYASGDRQVALASVTAPTLVIHGRDDTLITPGGGEATAAAIPGAHLLLLADMGHDLPRALWPAIVGAVVGISNSVPS